jgi:hypothetical protein
MKHFFTTTSGQKGYAILFAVVMVSIISTIAIGLSNSSYKQLVLSSLARDSQSAFYFSDTAIECALYADNVDGLFSAANVDSAYSCGVDKNGSPYALTKIVTSIGSDTQYTLEFTTPVLSDPCFAITVLKTTTVPTTDIKARGYNTCNFSSIRTVEREIEATY